LSESSLIIGYSSTLVILIDYKAGDFWRLFGSIAVKAGDYCSLSFLIDFMIGDFYILSFLIDIMAGDFYFSFISSLLFSFN